jgi:hypothetical protein
VPTILPIPGIVLPAAKPEAAPFNVLPSIFPAVAPALLFSNSTGLLILLKLFTKS